MPQFLADINNNCFTLDKDTARHLGVLRIFAGAEIKIFDGKGKCFMGKLEHAVNNSAGGVILREIPVKKPAVNITLYFCAISRPATEELLDNCTQLGVQAFCPVISQYTEKDLLKKWDTKQDRWQQIIIAACKQSCAATIPQILPPLNFKEALKASPGIICYEDEHKLNIPAAMAKLNGPQTLALHIGPEGGYSTLEVKQAQAAGIIPVTLGVNILRAQTAAAAAVAQVLS